MKKKIFFHLYDIIIIITICSTYVWTECLKKFVFCKAYFKRCTGLSTTKTLIREVSRCKTSLIRVLVVLSPDYSKWNERLFYNQSQIMYIPKMKRTKKIGKWKVRATACYWDTRFIALWFQHNQNPWIIKKISDIIHI